MAVYSDSEQLLEIMRSLFARVEAEYPAAGDAVSASHLVILIRCTRPDADVLINGRKRPPEIWYGPGGMRPTLTIETATDTLHEIMLGELSLKRALAQGALKVRGPVHRITVLADLFYALQKVYPDLVKEPGHPLS